VLDMSLTVRLSVSCYCSCIVCIMMSEINDGDADDDNLQCTTAYKDILLKPFAVMKAGYLKFFEHFSSFCCCFSG